MLRRRESSELNAKKRRFGRKRIRAVDEPSAMDLIEEGIHLLRQTSLLAWSVYFCGLAPFVVGFLFFWTEMATSGLAEQVLLPACLGMSVLFFWFKWTQAYFAKGLREALVGGAPEPWGFGVCFRVLKQQMIWQGAGLFVLSASFVLTVPFAWAFAFYQNVLVADPLDGDKNESTLRENWRLARIWGEQNWMLITLFSLVGLLSWINWMSLLFFGPYLLKSLLGLETLFSQVGSHLFNSTSFFACALLSYAVTDPLIKASYLLRRHYCESRRSGADLGLHLRRAGVASELAKRGAVAVLAVFSVLSLLTPVELSAARASDVVVVDAAELDASIEEVLERREFVWRFPREAMESDHDISWFRSFFDSIDAMQDRLNRWLEELFHSDEKKEERSEAADWDGDFSAFASFVSYSLIAVFVIAVLWLAVRAWKSYQPLDTIEGSLDTGVEVLPDLEDEEVSADLLPQDRWIEMARDFIAKGEYRLALRAYFLAQLAALSSEGLIVIQRFKSNREYAREIARRAHGRAGLLDVYGQQVDLFEGVWYGGHPSGQPEIETMERCLSEMGVLR